MWLRHGSNPRIIHPSYCISRVAAAPADMACWKGLPNKVPEVIWKPTFRSIGGPETHRFSIRKLELY
jgi:hypothetical protein